MYGFCLLICVCNICFTFYLFNKRIDNLQNKVFKNEIDILEIKEDFDFWTDDVFDLKQKIYEEK